MKSYSLINKDEVLLIDRLCHPGPMIWKPKYIVRVIEHGFYTIDSRGNELFVVRFCVHPDWRGMGIGTVMHLDLLKLAQQHSKKWLVTVIHEESESLTWLRDQWGWEAVKIKEGYYGNRDGYLMKREIIR